MLADDRIKILSNELKNSFNWWEKYKEGFDANIRNEKQNEYVKKVLNDEDLIKFYEIEDKEKIIEEYILKINEIRNITINPNNSDKQNILNVLEYMRHMHSFDNISRRSFPNCRDLSLSPVFQAFLGKGVCVSQVGLLEDILSNDINIKSRKVSKMEGGMLNDLVDHTVNVFYLDSKEYYIDPTWYNGSVKSLEGSINKKYSGDKQYNSIEATDEEIIKARKEIQTKLINILKIDKISKGIISPEMTDIEKQCAIFTFIESILNHTDYSVNFPTAKLFNKNIEVGKLMELFFVENKIDYDIETNLGDKYQTIYNLEVDGEKVSLYPKRMYNSQNKKGESLTSFLHFKSENNMFKEFFYSSKKNDYKAFINLYGEPVNEGRKRVRKIDLSKLEHNTEDRELGF